MENYDFKIGDIICIGTLHYEYDQYNFLKSGMKGVVVEIVPTNNKNNWQRLNILLLDSPFTNIKLYSSEIELLSRFDISMKEINKILNKKEKCKMVYDLKDKNIINFFKKSVSEDIENYFDGLKEKLRSEDPIQNILKKYKNSIKEELSGVDNDLKLELENGNCEVFVNIGSEFKNIQSTTLETIKQLEYIESQRKLALENLGHFLAEINSVLCMCENFEQSIQVLRDYGIIEKKKVKVVSDFDFKVFFEDVI